VRLPIRITLRGHERRGTDLMLIFGVDEGHGKMTAKVLVVSGRPRFPHELCEYGSSFGPVNRRRGA
jgi:hypothetical protein